MIGMPLENCGSDVCPAWYSNRSSNCAGVIQNMPLIISPLPMTSRGCSAHDKVIHRRGPPTGAAPSRGSVPVRRRRKARALRTQLVSLTLGPLGRHDDGEGASTKPSDATVGECHQYSQ